MELTHRPAWRISANGSDITSAIADRFVSMTITDEAGIQSDTLNLVLADHLTQQRLALPPTGAELRVWLGYGSALSYMGLFVVDELRLDGPPDRLTISAKAAVHTAKSAAGLRALQSQKRRSWPVGTTMADVVKTIAGEHGMTPEVGAELAAIALPHTDQVDESDINLLTRLSRQYDLTIKPVDGRLIALTAAAGLTVTGRRVSSVAIAASEISQWSFTIANRIAAGKVVASWHDVSTGQLVEEAAGDQEPVRRLRHQFPDSASAKAAAASEYRRAARGEVTGSLTMPGRADLMAEGRATLSGIRPEFDDEWSVTRVEHQVSRSGWTVTAEISTLDRA